MKNLLLSLVSILFVITSFSQKKEEYFDYNFKPSENSGRYYVITEKKGDLWHRQAFYLPELTQAMDGWYKDEACKIAHDTTTWFHTSKYVWSRGRYIDGKKEGIWLTYNEEGMLKDSSNYVNGHLKGIGLGWHSNGIMSDSTNFDGQGVGVRFNWDEDGNITSAGYIEQDTLLKGRWKYFHKDGTSLAFVDYVGGKKINCECYDEKGTKLDTALCNKEEEASFPGGMNGWIRFLERNLNPMAPIKKRAKDGSYTVVLRFRVDKQGNIQDLKAITNHGYGMEQEALRVLRLSPKWIPAIQFGQKVNAYRQQPITFVVSK